MNSLSLIASKYRGYRSVLLLCRQENAIGRFVVGRQRKCRKHISASGISIYCFVCCPDRLRGRTLYIALSMFLRRWSDEGLFRSCVVVPFLSSSAHYNNNTFPWYVFSMKTAKKRQWAVTLFRK